MRLPILLLMLLCWLHAMPREDDGTQYEGPLYISATYKEKIKLPKGSFLHVRVEDLSASDLIVTTVTSVRKSIEGYPPFSIRLDLEYSELDPSHRYGMRVMINDGSALRFINGYAVDPRKPPFDIMLKAVTPYSQ